MDRTERFRGRLMAGDRLVYEPVEGFLKTHQRAGGAIGEWTGHFDVPASMPEPLVEGNRYRLVLIDGRSGSVNLHVTRGDEETPSRAQFHGTGTFRR